VSHVRSDLKTQYEACISRHPFKRSCATFDESNAIVLLAWGQIPLRLRGGRAPHASKPHPSKKSKPAAAYGSPAGTADTHGVREIDRGPGLDLDSDSGGGGGRGPGAGDTAFGGVEEDGGYPVYDGSDSGGGDGGDNDGGGEGSAGSAAAASSDLGSEVDLGSGAPEEVELGGAGARQTQPESESDGAARAREGPARRCVGRGGCVRRGPRRHRLGLSATPRAGAGSRTMFEEGRGAGYRWERGVGGGGGWRETR
jgi:hypothetical protein